MSPVVDLVVALGMLVIVPLGLRLLPLAGTDRVAWVYPLFAVPGVVALWLPRGDLSTTLACWYGVGTLLLVALAARHAWTCLSRKAVRATDAAAVTALACPAIAAFALVAERSSTEVFGFSLTILALTVPHFHYAGFAAALVAHLVAAARPSAVTTSAAWSVPAGTLVVLVGYFVNDEVELLGAAILTAGMWLVGWTLWTRGRERTGDPRTRLLLGVSAVTLVLTMLLALDWAVGHVVDAVPHLPLAWMAWTHGLANAIGFALCALVAWTRMRAAREAD